jgi:hypothetical protein
MGTTKNWLLSQWADIRGSVKFWIISIIAGSGVVSAMITSLTRHIQRARGAAQQDRLGYIILGLLIFCAFLLIASVVALLLRTFTTNIQPMPEPVAESQKAELQELTPPPPKSVDLHGSIEGLYFFKPDSYPAFSSYSIYMKLRITNRGTDEAVITKWHLYIRIGKDDKVQGTVGVIPSNMAIKRVAGNAFLGTPNFIYESVQPDLTKVPVHESYRKGIPKEGWVRFDPNDYGSEPPHNGAFFIFIEDSLGNTHWIERKPQSYKSDGELVELPGQNALGLGSGG